MWNSLVTATLLLDTENAARQASVWGHPQLVGEVCNGNQTLGLMTRLLA